MADSRGFEVDDNPEWGPENTRPVADASARLRVTRAFLGITQQDLAELLGVPLATLRNWEQRRTEPDNAAQTLIRLLAEHPQQVYALLRPTERA
jgi:putative transcriptional regulator